MLCAGRLDVLSQLPLRAFWRAASAIEVAGWRHLGRQLAVRLVLHRAVPAESGAETMDGVFVAEPGSGAAVFRLRHHPLSLDGCGHHLQARPGTYRGDGGGCGGVFLAGRPEWRHLPHHDERSVGGGPGDHDCIVSVSAGARMDSVAARSLLLPGPPRLSPDADRIWPDADQRSPVRSDAHVGVGPD